jgi:hypothetical protein
MASGNYCRHLRAARAGRDFQAAAEMFYSLFHSDDSDASAYGGVVQHSAGYAPPMIADGNGQSIGDILYLDGGLVASGMQVNIGKAGLHNPEDGKFGFFG